MNMEIPLSEVAIVVTIVAFFLRFQFDFKRLAENTTSQLKEMRDRDEKVQSRHMEILENIAKTQKETMTLIYDMSANNKEQHARIQTLLEERLQK